MAKCNKLQKYCGRLGQYDKCGGLAPVTALLLRLLLHGGLRELKNPAFYRIQASDREEFIL